MENKNFAAMTDEQLLIEKKKLRNTKIFYAVSIGFLAGIFIFGIVSWSLSSDKNIGFLIPMAIPVIFIYNMLKKPKKNTELENVLKERGLQ